MGSSFPTAEHLHRDIRPGFASEMYEFAQKGLMGENSKRDSYAGDIFGSLLRRTRLVAIEEISENPDFSRMAYIMGLSDTISSDRVLGRLQVAGILTDDDTLDKAIPFLEAAIMVMDEVAGNEEVTPLEPEARTVGYEVISALSMPAVYMPLD